MKKLRILFMALTALALAAPASAQVLNNSERPGSVLVFHKFLRGTVAPNVPKSSFEISVVCPPGRDCLTQTPGGGTAETVRIKGLWVCPGSQAFSAKRICAVQDFILRTTVKGTLWFNPENAADALSPQLGAPSSTNPNPAPQAAAPILAPVVPAPRCDAGYLIVWVVDGLDRPVSFNGLIGDAIIRKSVNDAEAYNALPIQAVNPVATTVIGGTSDALVFDGTMYARVTGQIFGTVRYDQAARPLATPPVPRIQTDLTLLTLDVRANRANFVTFVPLVFYNEKEQGISTFVEFICWMERGLSRASGADNTFIDRNLNTRFGGMQAKKGLVESSDVARQQDTDSFDPNTFNIPATVVGIIETTEYRSAGVIERTYAYNLFNDGIGIPTRFCHNLASVCPIP